MFRTELVKPLPVLLAGHAARQGGKVAFRDAWRAVTYAELDRRTGVLAGHLTRLRVRPGDRVAILLGNRVENVESYLAIVRAAGVGVPLNPLCGGAELAYLLDDSGATVLITDPAHVDQVRPLLAGRRHLRVIVTGDRPYAGLLSFETLCATDPETPARDDLGLDDVAWMLYTSGTTGRPKGVLSTQRNCLWSVAACYAAILGLSADDEVLWPTPLFHSLAHVFCVIGVTAVGASAHVLDGLTAADVLDELTARPYTFLAGVPATYHQLVAAARDMPARDWGLRRCLVAGSVSSAELRTAFEETFGQRLLDGYGSTETCGLMAVNWPDGDPVPGSCGLPVPGLDLRVVDPRTGADVEVGAEGEVWVRGPSLFAGYHGRPEETAQAMRNGWYHTDDLARRDEAGYLRVTGRISELIIRGGENIHPSETEAVLRTVPGVADVAVVGRPDDALGEVPVAFVVPAADRPDPDAMLGRCRERLSGAKVPEELYEVAAVPRTPSGKIMRHRLLTAPARLWAVNAATHRGLRGIGLRALPEVPAAVPGEIRTVGAGEPDGTPHDAVVLVAEGGARTGESRAAALRRLAGSVAADVRAWRQDAARLLVVVRGSRVDAAAARAALRSAGSPQVTVLGVEPGDPEPLAEALGAGEPELVVHQGALSAPRAITVLATPGTALGPVVLLSAVDTPLSRLLTRHLVEAHRVRQFVLVAGDHGLATEIRRLGARAVVVPDLDQAPEVSAVVHLGEGDAGDDIDTVFALDEFARTAAVRHFVLIGQGTDGDVPAALARERRASGLPALFLNLPAARLSDRRTTDAFDLALGHEEPVLVAGSGDWAVEPPRRGDFAARLRDTPPGQRPSLVLDMVLAQCAAVLADPCRPDRALREAGLTSVGAVALRDRLAAETGLSLASSLVFDHPTPGALAAFLDRRLAGDGPAVPSGPTASTHEPVAIVGVGCRYPGGVESAEGLWGVVSEGRDVVSGFPVDRGWDLAGLFDEDPDRRGRSYAREGGFLHEAGFFDAGFFGVGPREALGMDPQQRLLLEVSWEAVESAGIDPLSLRGSRTGTYTGLMRNDYGRLPSPATNEVEGMLETGSAGSVASGRVAYTLGLEGPALTVDTACSSSLVALHLAVRSLRSGECDMALVGGATVMSTPMTFVEFSRQRGLSPDGRCKPFAAGADGTAFGEGVGVLVLERLSDAVQAGRRILGVIRGTAINQDGASNGLTAPSGPAQQRVIWEALSDAGLKPDEIDAVEAHGTGTTLGDPIEAQALLATYGQGRSQPLRLGSVKSNIGHTQAAAGVAGVVKMLMAFTHNILPRTLHIDEPSPHVDWSQGSVELLTENTPWPTTGRPRRAGVSSFGVSGTNAHVIIEEPPPSPQHDREGAEPAVVPWLLSAKTPEALHAQASKLTAFLTAHEELRPSDIAYSLMSRTAFEHRAVVIGGAKPPAGLDGPDVVRGVAAPVAPRVVFVYPGQGSQWIGMGEELLATSEVFAEWMSRCDEALAPWCGWSLLDVIRRADGAPSLDRDDVVQPVLFAVMASLTQVWRGLGVTPAAVVGHSQGEITAAYASGALTLSEAARIVAVRSRVLRTLAGRSSLASVGLSVEEAAEVLPSTVTVAAVNGPSMVTVAGTLSDLDTVLARCEERGVPAKTVPIDYASHSPQIEEIRDRLLAELGPVRARDTDVPMLSTVTGDWVSGGELTEQYWYRNLREPVLFAPAVTALAESGHRFFLEVSARPVLSGAIVAAHDVTAVATLRRGDAGLARLLTAAAELHVGGVDIDWAAALPGAVKVPVPTYAFQREHYWLDPAPAADDGRFWELVRERGGRLSGPERDAFELLAPRLRAWRDEWAAESTVDAWRHRIAWVPATGTPGRTGHWTVLVPPGHGPLTGLTDAVSRRGGTATVLEVDPRRPDFRALPADGAGKVLSLLALGDGLDSEQPPPGFAATVELVQALGGTELWCVTAGAVDDTVSPAQALLWGLGRVAAAEHPEVWGGVVDMPTAPTAADHLALVDAISDPAGENEFAVRGGAVTTRRLRRAPLSATPVVRSWRPRGTVAITGGTGALGGHVARWLAATGAEHLLLLSRRGEAAPGAAGLVAELTATGTRVSVAACDIGDRDDLAAALRGHRLDAVVHTAAELDDTTLGRLTRDRIARALRAKALGAVHLHELTRDHDLSAFVMFSSIAAVCGLPGQANYAPGNAFLSAFAEYRRSLGLPATAIEWGQWTGDGIVAPRAERELRRAGLVPLPVGPAIRALAASLDRAETRIAVVDADWSALGPTPLLAGLSPTAEAAGPPENPLARWADAPEKAQRRAVGTLVRDCVAASLGHRSADAVDDARSFRDQGFDSLGAVDLRNRLNRATGLNLPTTIVFEHRDPARLADHLWSALFAPQPSASDGLDALDDREVAELLSREFGIS
ncbi:SDR family NAD(P)-dependent oxidoreductase [Streptomyces roseirectus]|uniref:SDR family NAD(P)-dependent oxidoreductase n=1 Tax=Streptomyces roseirectus TaxID=2768066 RepID=A0A7H0IPX2_9ACTN|nr:type I polyketide synthase [Streptomyces roseirectus]QNP74838.1 SDR family NAD(P)-dependent oxidoreductase [Streptomyces roseirectus]